MEKQFFKSSKKGNGCVTSKKKRMKINTELIRRCSSKNLLPLQNSDDLLDRITHLYLQEQHIRKIENLHSCRNLRALYLYDNKIETIENLEDLALLNCLYLHKNFIKRIENLDALSQLTVLNLSHNCISKVEGLDALSELRELYLQYQNLPDDQSLEFEPSTVTWLSESLRVLNVSGNKVKSLLPFMPLENLEQFSAEENEMCDLHELVEVFSNWKYVMKIKLTGNPVCAVRKYRDNVVVACLELEIKNKQLSPPRSARSSSVAPKPNRSDSASSSQSETSVNSKSRSKSVQRLPTKAKSLQEVPMKIMKKITGNR
ncbi:protein phosphatase 1 regulatory subunit 42 [Nephila pilipes]|uniref:Protein phosphatase 1 regulatory subunit 42 n=1 Tax=Nephila pilipes TaxID=299642 RepID=A0A8X6N2Z8_NEPPI|nr:protein phosphatase 1 regulatory subunit 42 [Nephila pilipes]